MEPGCLPAACLRAPHRQATSPAQAGAREMEDLDSGFRRNECACKGVIQAR